MALLGWYHLHPRFTELLHEPLSLLDEHIVMLKDKGEIARNGLVSAGSPRKSERVPREYVKYSLLRLGHSFCWTLNLGLNRPLSILG